MSEKFVKFIMIATIAIVVAPFVVASVRDTVYVHHDGRALQYACPHCGHSGFEKVYGKDHFCGACGKYLLSKSR